MSVLCNVNLVVVKDRDRGSTRDEVGGTGGTTRDSDGWHVGGVPET